MYPTPNPNGWTTHRPSHLETVKSHSSLLKVIRNPSKKEHGCPFQVCTASKKSKKKEEQENKEKNRIARDIKPKKRRDKQRDEL